MSSRDDRRRRERSWEREDRDKERNRNRDRDRRSSDYHRRRDNRSRSRSPRYGDRDGRSDRRGYDRDDDRRGRDRRDDRRREDRRPHDPDERRDSGRHTTDKERQRDGGSKSNRSEAENLKESPSKTGQPSGPVAPLTMATSSKEGGSENGQVEPGEEPESMDAETDEQDIGALMGFGGFDSTKGKPVQGNQEGSVSIKKQRTWRQYMNRRGGFNRPLDKIK